MISAVLQIDYSNVDKPFCLTERHHTLGGTEYYQICRLDEVQARLLHNEGISWLYGEPNWTEHYKKLQVYKAKRDLKLAEDRLRSVT